ncbi:SDR family NAD(P)-dependent oxidoreductase [Saccharothrix coeruleofusca]|uniref:2-deoxy-D-gluconate 3-dehydrogenase n=1 Tax=Saccharothrix coeruleofusca TaxID=33919 RepID=A0A918AS06_9PSEU|nr:SDR family oxidoreductase [Saccharothrix coeruleofusca]MBP2336003.1 NAD(P)-dependent dehydrogenase (short-subunit alcohol dehydrogenase family) [Saccharothrix coeruleofusca]GGP76068.1 2-deoxy-D-gluconate 3-dehydrogenase [Saccharothrix coeruleofusca]
MAGRFAGRRVVVTGGGRGIGRAVALAFAAEGADVAVLARTKEQVDAVAAEMAPLGGRYVAVSCDVGDAEQVAAADRQVTEAFGGVDVLVNAAGVFTMGPSADFPADQVNELLTTNVAGTLRCCQVFGRHMLAAGAGKIVNFGSLLSFTAFPERAAYAASKAGVVQLTRVLGVEWAAAGVNVNGVAPGMIRIETPHPAALAEDDIVARIPAGRRGAPADITGPVLFLASADADYVNGQTIVVDGGWLSYGYL